MKLSAYLNTKKRGGKAALARAIGAYHSDLSDWIAEKRPIPVRYCSLIEKATEGVVSRKDMRPHDWRLIWPELDQLSTSSDGDADVDGAAVAKEKF